MTTRQPKSEKATVGSGQFRINELRTNNATIMSEIQHEALRLLEQRGFGAVYLGREDGWAHLQDIRINPPIARKVVALLTRGGAILGTSKPPRPRR